MNFRRKDGRFRGLCRLPSRLASGGAFHPGFGFTLIELMVVIGIMAIVLTTGVPLVYRVAHKQPMRNAESGIVEVCSNARALAILKGTPMDVVFRPQEGRLDIVAAADLAPPARAEDGPEPVPAPTPVPSQGQRQESINIPGLRGSGRSALIGPEVQLEMLDVNLREYRLADAARVRFYPNGTCDEMTIVLQSRGEWRKIWTEVTTGLIEVGNLK